MLLFLVFGGCSQPDLSEAATRDFFIQFALPQPGDVVLKILNRFDTPIKTFDMPETTAGYHSVVWDGKDNNGDYVPLGIYWGSLFLDGKQVGRTIQIQLFQEKSGD